MGPQPGGLPAGRHGPVSGEEEPVRGAGGRTHPHPVPQGEAEMLTNIKNHTLLKGVGSESVSGRLIADIVPPLVVLLQFKYSSIYSMYSDLIRSNLGLRA